MKSYLPLLLASLLPQVVLAHDSTFHANQTLLQELLNLDHFLLYGLPTLLLLALAYRKTNLIIKSKKDKTSNK